LKRPGQDRGVADTRLEQRVTELFVDLFESEDERPSAYVMRRRLENSARLLRGASWRGRTVTDIALRNGFNNVSHFGFAFKRRFGMTPRDYRVTEPTA
jgi:AraC-like DNA-binding protein